MPDLFTVRSLTTLPDAAPEAREEGLGAGPMPSIKVDIEESVTSVEPKQRGRFKIVAEQGTAEVGGVS